ncbi:MAG: hypothetical protein K2P81_04310 [Bacteriovoracaceae bacterium]|nr:hypothetical protein [Bacteriovoracaceae bacterium]
MKIFTGLFVASILAIPTANAQDLLQGLLSSQVDATTSGGRTSGSGGTPTTVVTPTVPTVTSTSQSLNCPSSGQKTVPLKYVVAMLRTKGASLQITHDTAQGRLNVRGGDFLSNCNSMLEWGLRSQTSDFPQYVVELKIKSCGADTCPFKVMEVNASGEQVEKEISVKPDFSGFQQCLKETGVVNATGGVDAKKIVSRDLEVSFDGVENSGPVWFGSHLPGASAVYKKQQEKDCYYMEDIRQGGYAVYSSEDSERMRLDQQAQLVCQSGDYRHISDFLERYGQYGNTLSAIRDELILKDYKALAEDIKKGEGLETKDYSIIADFQRYIIDPLTTRISNLYEKIGSLPQGQERRLKEQELQGLMKQLAAYKSSPYISKTEMDKLMAKGLFDEAASVNAIHLTAQHYGRLGANESGALVTPRVARQRISEGKQTFQRNLVSRREQFEVQTGRLSGKSEYYAGLAAQHRKNITIRTNNYQTEINNEVARVTQPNGYCFKYFRNTQKCVQDSIQRIQELRSQLQLYNQSDADIAADLEAKANQYRAWENDGQRYVASQNGEEPEVTNTNTEVAPTGPSVTAPQADRQDEQQALYQFQMPQQQQNPYMQQMPTMQQGGMPGMQYNPGMQQQQYSGMFSNMMGAPWGQQSYNPYQPMQSPYMGYGMQNGGQGYSFNMGGQMGMQGYGGNMWGGQQNPYMMGGAGGYMGGQMGMQGYGGMQGGMPGMGMYQSPFSQGMGQGLSYFR